MKVLVSAIMLAMSLSAPPHMGIVTGGVAGTYIKIGEDIKKIAEPSGVYLEVLESAGAWSEHLFVVCTLCHPSGCACTAAERA